MLFTRSTCTGTPEQYSAIPIRIFKGKLHSETKIFNLVAIFFVEFDGESPRSKFEQEHGGRKWLKISGDEDAANVTSLVPGVKNPKTPEWSGIRPGVIGLLRQVAYKLIPADQEHFESLA